MTPMPRTCSPFASRSLPLHLLRGFGGLLALAAALLLFGIGGPLELTGAGVAAIVAAILLRGCPMCWVIGLFETALRRVGH